MKVIHKQLLELKKEQRYFIKGYINSFKVAEQDGDLYLWFLRDALDSYIKEIEVEIYGTGHPISSGAIYYFDSVLMSNGLVWHIFLR